MSLGAWLFTHNKKGKTVLAPTAMGPPTFSSGSPPLGPLLKAGHRSIDVPDFDSLLSVETNPGRGNCGFYVAAAMYGTAGAGGMRAALAEHFRTAPEAIKLAYARAMPAVAWRKLGPTDALAAAENFSHARNHQNCHSFAQAPAGPLRPSSPWARCSCCPCIDKLKYNAYIENEVMRSQMDNLMWQACRARGCASTLTR